MSLPLLRRSLKCEKGAVLALTLVVMVVLMGMIGATFVAVHGDQSISRRLLLKNQAEAAADAGLYSLLTHWDTRIYNTIEVGESAKIPAGTSHGGATYSGTLNRLGSGIFLASIEGVSRTGRERQRSGALFRLHSPRLLPRAALETRGKLHIGPLVKVSGHDTEPLGWSCPAPEVTIAGLRISSPNATNPVPTGCTTDECLRGQPGFITDTEVEASGVFDFSGSMVDDLRVVARHTLTGGSVRPSPKNENGTCVTESQDNWGNPIDRSGPCGDYLPVIFSNGDLTVDGGFGQGVLVVSGNLAVMGGFQYRGVVVVAGIFSSIGEGSRIDGAVIAANSNLGEQIVDGATVIRYSSCAVARAMGGLGRGVLLRERSWLDLY